jgi:hypothetical protein
MKSTIAAKHHAGVGDEPANIVLTRSADDFFLLLTTLCLELVALIMRM